MNNQRLTGEAMLAEAMLAEAKAFQREVTRGKDHRGHGGASSQRPGAYGSGTHNGAGIPRGPPRQPVAQNLATPEQFFGRQSRPPPAAPQTPTMPATQQPVSGPVDNYEPMQVDSTQAAAQAHNDAAPTTGRGLVGSRWATSSRALKQAPPKMPPPVTAPVAPAYACASINTGMTGTTTNKAPTFPYSSQLTALDTPEIAKASKGLLGSKWAAGTSPASPSPMTLRYPDPATLEPVYRSDDWLSDLSTEYEELSIKTKNISENQPTRQAPLTRPAAAQTVAETAKPPPSESQQPGQNPTNFSAASQRSTTVQASVHAVTPNQASDTNSGPSTEFGRIAPSAQAASNQGGTFNDSAFKDWYNCQFMRSQFMRREA